VWMGGGVIGGGWLVRSDACAVDSNVCNFLIPTKFMITILALVGTPNSCQSCAAHARRSSSMFGSTGALAHASARARVCVRVNVCVCMCVCVCVCVRGGGGGGLCARLFHQK
jgi:hypothetical protein